MLKFAALPMLIGAVLLRIDAGAQPVKCERPSPSHGREWRVSATVSCQIDLTNAAICSLLLGSTSQIHVEMTIHQDIPTPGFVGGRPARVETLRLMTRSVF